MVCAHVERVTNMFLFTLRHEGFLYMYNYHGLKPFWVWCCIKSNIKWRHLKFDVLNIKIKYYNNFLRRNKKLPTPYRSLLEWPSLLLLLAAGEIYVPQFVTAVHRADFSLSASPLALGISRCAIHILLNCVKRTISRNTFNKVPSCYNYSHCFSML